MELPDGVVDVRKVKTAGGGEGGRAHLTWVIAYSERIEVGSPPHEAIRKFAGALKAPRNMDHSVMLLPVISREPREPPAPEKAPPKVRAKPRAKARVDKARIAKARVAKVRVAKVRVKVAAKARPKTRAKVAAAKSRARTIAKSPTRKPARRPRRARR
jgi:hypothetical protein